MNANKISELQKLADTKGVALAMAQFCGPKQTTIAYMLTRMWEDIIDAADAGDPFSLELTEWAERCFACETSKWFFDNPDAPVTFQWPFVPVGRDNERLHGLWAMLKREYARMCAQVDDAEKTAKAIKEFESVHGSASPSLEQQDSIALAMAEKLRWRNYGMHSFRR